jgi:transcriptional regulator with XRE-family HTH domain
VPQYVHDEIMGGIAMSVTKGKLDPPTAKRWLLGVRLHSYRTQTGMTLQRVATLTGSSRAKLSRQEGGTAHIHLAELNTLCRIYRVPDDGRTALVALAKACRERGWWADGRHMLSDPYAAWEADASKIRVAEPALIPELLQTPDYARSVIRARRPAVSAGETEYYVSALLARQEAVCGADNPPPLDLVFDESAIERCRAATPNLARTQITALLTAADQPQVTLRVARHASTLHPFGPCTLLSFGPSDPTIALVSTPIGRELRTTPQAISAYEHVWHIAAAAALPEAETIDYLTVTLRHAPRY